MKCRLTERGWIREGEGLWICLTLVFAGTTDGAMLLLEVRGADCRRRVVPGRIVLLLYGGAGGCFTTAKSSAKPHYYYGYI